MRENDARRLDYRTLEAMRERAVRQVQLGERPEGVARVLGQNQPLDGLWVAGAVPARWLRRVKRSPCLDVRRNWMGGR
jgi:hypothetical protein